MRVLLDFSRELGIACFLAILLALIPPWLLSARERARRHACQDNLRRIMAALLEYEDRHGRLPPAYVADEKGVPRHSWRVLILPFLGQQRLYDQYSFDEPWDGPHNRLLAAQMPDVFRCPAATHGAPITSYALVTGPGLVFDADRAWKSDEIAAADGRRHTVLVVESPAAQINWLEPRDLSLSLALHGSAHPTVIHAGFADGHVQALNKDIAPKVLEALLKNRT